MKKKTRTQYCLGFMFSRDFKKVALIQKAKPEWQAGKFNGIGGKVEEGETYIEAMTREFFEETGVYTPSHIWIPICKMFDKARLEWSVKVFYSTNLSNYHIETTTAEEVRIFETQEILSPTRSIEIIPNLTWLIPMCMDENDISGMVMYG